MGTVQYVVSSLGGGSTVNPNETVNITLTQIGGNSADLIGTTVIVTNTDTQETMISTTWSGTIITTEIQAGTDYEIEVGSISGYIIRMNTVSYQASAFNIRNISFQYASYGVYIEATDGSLYTAQDWASASKVKNSVVLLNSTKSFRISLSEKVAPLNNELAGRYDDYVAILANPQNDYNSKVNTDSAVAFSVGRGIYNTDYAAGYARNYYFTYPGEIGNIPAYGEMNLMLQNITSINEALTACNSTTLNNTDGGYLTSTTASVYQPDSSHWVMIYSTDGNVTGMNNDYTNGFFSRGKKTRPICDYD